MSRKMGEVIGWEILMRMRSGYSEHPEVIRVGACSQKLREWSSGILKNSPMFNRWSGKLMARNGM